MLDFGCGFFVFDLSLQSFLYISYASFTFISPWIIALTAFIIGTGLSDCQMLRPMSTPTAPALIALYANCNASRSGIFFPPATMIGTGHDSTTFLKLSQ